MICRSGFVRLFQFGLYHFAQNSLNWGVKQLSDKVSIKVGKKKTTIKLSMTIQENSNVAFF